MFLLVPKCFTNLKEDLLSKFSHMLWILISPPYPRSLMSRPLIKTMFLLVETSSKSIAQKFIKLSKLEEFNRTIIPNKFKDRELVAIKKTFTIKEILMTDFKVLTLMVLMLILNLLFLNKNQILPICGEII